MESSSVHIELHNCLIRNWLRGDEPSLVRHANNRKVWRNLRDSFPNPYTMADARQWVNLASTRLANQAFAIDVGGFAVGGIGLRPDDDINRHCAEIGYWLGEEYWGRGIATEAVTAVTDYALRSLGFGRLYAQIFEWNESSVRVLEKSGYEFEGRLRKSAIKEGTVIDQLLYACVR